jgi:eukaryotic-like serine/threonine-protein kinase
MTAQARLLGGRYQVGELLGYGGMAEVHRGRDTRLGRDVAIKTLRHDLARDATFQLRFRREAQNAASLNHPAIVAVYDTGEEHGLHGEELPYIVMEFVNGKTLKEVLTVEGRLQPRRAMEICADICSALDFSHRHSIIHRDIKPGNVMLTQTGQVKVMDFGIARALAGAGASTMTQTSAVIGTAQYLSPEQARGEAVDARSDVYATGCVVFELLTGQPPFIGDNPVSVAYQHVREDPRAPSDYNSDVTPDMDAIVLKALAKNPLNRYQSAGEMRADLLRAAAGRPVSAPPVMTEAERTAMMAPPQRPVGPPTRTAARVADRGKPRKGNTAIVVLITILGMLAFGALGLGLYLANQNKDVTVPTLVGKSPEQARTELETAGLKAQEKQAAAALCNNTNENKVISQTPPAQAQASKGQEVSYDVCLPPGKTTVPPLLNLTKAAAEEALKARNLRAKFESVDGTAAIDTVVGANPPSGTEVAVNTEVTVQLSKNNQRVMPPLAGLTEGQAKAELASKGFDPKNVTVKLAPTSEPDSVGKVIGQTPGAGQTAAKNAQITITIGQKPPTPTNTSSSPPGTEGPATP